MKILIVFATNSGSTQAACEVAKNILTVNGANATTLEAKSADTQEISKNDILILASPSWDYGQLEGQPLEDMTNFLKKLEGTNLLKDKPVAILGLGDTGYTHFCGAVEIMEAKVKELGGKIITDSLKIDRYYTQPDGPQKVATWAQQLARAPEKPAQQVFSAQAEYGK